MFFFKLIFEVIVIYWVKEWEIILIYLYFILYKFINMNIIFKNIIFYVMKFRGNVNMRGYVFVGKFMLFCDFLDMFLNSYLFIYYYLLVI